MNKKFSIVILFLLIPFGLSAQRKAMTLTDVMQFKSLSSQQISSDGNWVVASAWPERGDGYVYIKEVRGRRSYSIELGKDPIISPNGQYVAMSVTHPYHDLFKISKPSDRPKDGMLLVDVRSGAKTPKDEVKSFQFSNDSKWLMIQYHNSTTPDSLTSGAKVRKSIGSELELIQLSSQQSLKVPMVSDFSIDSTSTHLVVFVSDSTGSGNALKYLNLSSPDLNPTTIYSDSASHFSNFEWDNENGRLFFLYSDDTKDGKPEHTSLMTWQASSGELETLVRHDQVDGWMLPVRNSLRYRANGNRLFFGFRPVTDSDVKKKTEEANPFDFDHILKDVGLDVWHGNDPRIKTNEKVVWRQQQNQLYQAVFHLSDKTLVRLADENITNVQIPENTTRALAIDNTPYLREITWMGTSAVDVYTVDLLSGEKNLHMEGVYANVSLSPSGDYLLYYSDRHWHSLHLDSGVHKNLTESILTPFYNEDHDSPSEPSGYGVAGWEKGTNTVMIYDKFDIWKFNLLDGQVENITSDGRNKRIQYRVQFTDRSDRAFKAGETYLIHGYNDQLKNTGFYSFIYGRLGVNRLIEDHKRFRFIAKAEHADQFLYSREAYDEFPDLWVTDSSFRRPIKTTDLNKQLDPFAWGKAELVEWSSMDGNPVQGVLIKPGNYVPGNKYPVIVYFYELFSQRLHEFNPQLVNHRPSFPFYASNDYAIFLPDVRYTEGLPGYSAIKYIVPGVQKIIDMGVADPKAIGLHGHSWSGYQAAHMITMTDIFAAVVSGAPVSNMTSAYSGIRWGTGLARQFQYEKTQSRLGKTMWERLDLYIENSPVFYADRINTPILIQFGDEDEAVPWYQGIELYLALRRLDKDVIFLQYHGEPHHLQKYANKLDYSIKMKEYFDYHLKGIEAPDWIRDGVPYKGN